jgi:hypothetical protein
MEEGIGSTEKENLEGGSGLTLQASVETLPSTEFVKVEKNLASLGFFTPSSKRTRNERAKTVAVTILLDGKRIEAKATIAPTALFGLPITADQDKWLALHKILSDIQTRDGRVTNPVSFSSAELLALLKIYKDSGKNYKDVSDWLDVMVGTTIISEGAVYSGGKRVFGKDRFHVFDHAVSFGKQLPDGTVADKNYVWLSQWQLQNINDHHQLPIDLDTYRQLKNFISKALVPLLQVWLYTTRGEGVFEKRYDQLCQILNIRQWNYISKIKEKLGPSLDELRQFGYLADWRIEKTNDKHTYKILFFHGEKFHRDRRARLVTKQSLTSTEHSVTADPPHFRRSEKRPATDVAIALEASASQVFDPQLVAEFTRRGIDEKKANQLLANLKPGQDVVAQLEQAEQMIQHAGFQIRNPAGFTIRLIERNIPVPDGFETSAKRKAREERERTDREQRAAQETQQELEGEYESYRDAEVDRYIEANAAAFDELKDAKWKADRERYSFTTETMAKLAARFEIQKQLPLLTFEEFLIRKQQGADFSLKSVGLSPDTDPASVAPSHEDVAMADDAMIESERGETAAKRGEEVRPEPHPPMKPTIPDASIYDPASEGAKPPTNPGRAVELPSELPERQVGSSDPPSLFV